jgi:methyl-accepting chemotaxis protein
MTSIDDAMASHVIWKRRLKRLINEENNEPLESAVVRRDDLCDLGKWIYGEGAEYKGIKAYEDLVKKHADFHIWVADVVEKFENGDKTGAQAAAAGAFDSKSREIVSAIAELKKIVTAL